MEGINEKDLIFSLDIGTRSIKAAVGIFKGKVFKVLEECYIEHEERAMKDGQIHDIPLVAQSVKKAKDELEAKLGVTLKEVSIAAAGRFLKTQCGKGEILLPEDQEITKDMVKSLELTGVKLAEEKALEGEQFNIYCVGYSVINYYLNGYVMSNLVSHKGKKIEVEVIATFLPNSVVDSLYAVINKVGLEVISLTLEPIAAMEVVIPQNLRLLNLALVDIGAGTSDIAISNRESISAYGMIPLAGDEITEKISQSFLVDFNTAEQIKKDCSKNETINFTDILGFSQEIPSSKVFECIEENVQELGEKIGDKILELNGGKAPSAVFLVGGGAYTPLLREFLCKKIGIPFERIGIKGREGLANCECKNVELGSIGVTVLGIAMIAFKNSSKNFISVELNESMVSIFNNFNTKVMDALIQGGINPKTLIGKNGKNIRFKLNGVNRISFGAMGKNAVIYLNGKESSVEEKMQDGDIIKIDFAQNGKDAVTFAKEYITSDYVTEFIFNGERQYVTPIIYANLNKVNLNYQIEEEDNIEIKYVRTISDFLESKNIKLEGELYKDGIKIKEDYLIREEDSIFLRKIEDEEVNNFGNDKSREENINFKGSEETSINFQNNVGKNLELIVNGHKLTLKGKTEYVFIDVFDFIEFDRTCAKGNLCLLLNDKKAAYLDKLSQGDKLTIKWEE